MLRRILSYRKQEIKNLLLWEVISFFLDIHLIEMKAYHQRDPQMEVI